MDKIIPDCPEDQKYHGGYDPASPPTVDEEGFTPQEIEENEGSDRGEQFYKEEL